MSEWREKEALIESKMEQCEQAHEKQGEINKTQSDWNHQIDKRIDKVTENQTRMMIVIGAIMAAIAENAGQLFKMFAGFFKP